MTRSQFIPVLLATMGLFLIGIAHTLANHPGTAVPDRFLTEFHGTGAGFDGIIYLGCEAGTARSKGGSTVPQSGCPTNPNDPCVICPSSIAQGEYIVDGGGNENFSNPSPTFTCGLGSEGICDPYTGACAPMSPQECDTLVNYTTQHEGDPGDPPSP